MPVMEWLTQYTITPEIDRQMQESANSMFNDGYSMGLQYPWLYGERNGAYLVWCRYCGIPLKAYPDMEAAQDAVYPANGLSRYDTDQSVLNSIDETP